MEPNGYQKFIRITKLNKIYYYLIRGLDYNSIMEICPEISEDELNYILWYFASRGLRYIPTLS